MAIKTGDTKIVSHLKQIISLNIQKGNAASILGSLPADASMNEIFICTISFVISTCVLRNFLNYRVLKALYLQNDKLHSISKNG